MDDVLVHRGPIAATTAAPRHRLEERHADPLASGGRSRRVRGQVGERRAAIPCHREPME